MSGTPDKEFRRKNRGELVNCQYCGKDTTSESGICKRCIGTSLSSIKNTQKGSKCSLLPSEESDERIGAFGYYDFLMNMNDIDFDEEEEQDIYF